MKYGRVLTYKDIEEAKKLIGKKVVFGDNLFEVEECPEDRTTGTLVGVSSRTYYPFKTKINGFQFIREIIEEPQIMTNRQLAEWCAKGNGEYSRENSYVSFTTYCYLKSDANTPVPNNLRIRSWDSDEWVLPTVDIYERDCCGK